MANTMPKNSQDGGAAMLAGAVAPVNNLMLIDFKLWCFLFYNVCIHLFLSHSTTFKIRGATSGLGKFYLKRLKQIISKQGCATNNPYPSVWLNEL